RNETEGLSDDDKGLLPSCPVAASTVAAGHAIMGITNKFSCGGCGDDRRRANWPPPRASSSHVAKPAANSWLRPRVLNRGEVSPRGAPSRQGRLRFDPPLTTTIRYEKESIQND